MLSTTDDAQAYVKPISIECTPDNAAGIQHCILNYIAVVNGEREHNFFQFDYDPLEVNGMLFESAFETARVRHVI